MFKGTRVPVAALRRHPAEHQVAGRREQKRGMMIRVTKVEPRRGNRIWLLYSDGVSGVVDLSGLTGKGVFQAWDQPGAFDCVPRRNARCRSME